MPADPSHATRPEPRPIAESLTQRQLDVLDLLSHGLANKTIARRLGIGTCTVKTHVAHILRALDVTNRTEAAIFAQQEHPWPH